MSAASPLFLFLQPPDVAVVVTESQERRGNVTDQTNLGSARGMKPAPEWFWRRQKFCKRLPGRSEPTRDIQCTEFNLYSHITGTIHSAICFATL